METFSFYMDHLSARYGRNDVFNDFLTIAVCCLSMQQKEELYLSTIKRYRKDELSLFANAFAAMVSEMDNNGEGLTDVLGVYFENHFSNEKIGQFFTPPAICDLMAAMTPTEENQTLSDPCVGSGRLFLAAAKYNRKLTFYGADLSETCCKMTLINMCLNGLLGRVSWMNSLTLEVFKEWEIKQERFTKCPYISEVKEVIRHEDIEESEEIHEIKVDTPAKKTFAFKRFVA